METDAAAGEHNLKEGPLHAFNGQNPGALSMPWGPPSDPSLVESVDPYEHRRLTGLDIASSPTSWAEQVGFAYPQLGILDQVW